MPRGVDIYGAVLRELREDRGWSAAQLAEHAKAIAKAKGDRQFALDKHQICRYEHNRLRPSLRSLECMLTALEPSFADLRRLLKPSDPLAVLLELTREAKAEAVKVEEDLPMDRREFGVKLPLAVVAYAALPNVNDPLRTEIDTVTGAYATSTPQKLLPQARRVLDKITRALREPMLPGVRRRLLVDASEVAAVAGRMALFASHPGESHAYFVQARSFAVESGADVAKGWALVAASVLHDPLIGDGDSATALGMLQAAEPLIGTGGLGAKVVVMDQAARFAELDQGHHYEATRLLERADRMPYIIDKEGFYSLRGRFAGYDETKFAAWSGAVLARIRRTDEALNLLEGRLSEPDVNMRRPTAILGDIALAHTKAGQNPEPACQAAIRSLDASHAVGYTVGVDRVLRVRDMMPPAWTPLACMRALDDRLRAVT